jgi:hypothetical protein
MLSIPPYLLSANRNAATLKRWPQTNTATVSVVENRLIPTYHAEQGKHIGENGDRQDQPIKRLRVKVEV